MKIGILASTANQVTDFYLGNQVIRHCDVPVILKQRAQPQGAFRLARKVADTIAEKGPGAVVSSTRDWSFERHRQKEIRRFLEDRFADLGEKPEYDSGPRVVEVDDIHDRRSLQTLRDAGVTALFQNGAGIIRSPLIQFAQDGIVNVHHGYLPDIRGCQSIAWGLLEDHPEWIGVSVHLIDEGIDTGPILKRRHLTVTPSDTYQRLFVQATLLGGQLLVEAMRDLAHGAVQPIPRTSPGVYRSALDRRRWITLTHRTVSRSAEEPTAALAGFSATNGVTSAEPLTVVWHNTLDSPELEREWLQLCGSSPSASLFTTPHWCRCWLETVGATATPTVMRMVDGAGRTVGLLPLCVMRSGPARWLKFMGRERVSGDHLDLLASADMYEMSLSAALRSLARNDMSFDGVLLGELSPTCRLRSDMISWAENCGFTWHEREQRLVPFLELPDSFEEVLGTMSSNMRHQVRRRRRGFAQTANATLETVRTEQKVDETLVEFFRLHRLRWEQDSLPGNFRDPSLQEFLIRFCRTAARQGWLRIHVLRCGNETQAVLIAFHWGKTAYYYQMGWNPASPIASPGVVLMAESIEQAIREELSMYDFLRGDEPYKFRWTTQYTRQTTLAIGCHTTARMAIASERLKRRLKPSLQRCLGERNWERIRQAVKDYVS